MNHSGQLYAILTGKWQPDDDDLHALILNSPSEDGRRMFSWLRKDHRCAMTYDDVRPQPSVGTWCVVGTKLILCDPNERIEYSVEHNCKRDQNHPYGTRRHFSTVYPNKEHPDGMAAAKVAAAHSQQALTRAPGGHCRVTLTVVG